MTPRTLQRLSLEGAVGKLEVVMNVPDRPCGFALIAPPNPQQGGTLDNKIVTTLAKTAFSAGLIAARFNYRGIGASEGVWDNGVGETEDALCIYRYLLSRFDAVSPLVMLAGFSFGCSVQSQLLNRIASPSALVLVGPAAGRFPLAAVPSHTLVVHGEYDEVIPLADALAWARPQKLPITVFPDCGHFFHGRLIQLQHCVAQYLLVRLGTHPV